jgi:hypothetical protein
MSFGRCANKRGPTAYPLDVQNERPKENQDDNAKLMRVCNCVGASELRAFGNFHALPWKMYGRRYRTETLSRLSLSLSLSLALSLSRSLALSSFYPLLSCAPLSFPGIRELAMTSLVRVLNALSFRLISQYRIRRLFPLSSIFSVEIAQSHETVSNSFQ